VMFYKHANYRNCFFTDADGLYIFDVGWR